MNHHLVERLKGIQGQLVAGFAASRSLSSATKGRERELVIDEFLSKVLPPTYRFGSGDITDASGAKSGQIDVVVELPFAPSLPIIGSPTRLYLVEGVAAALEVKSDVAGQWDEVVVSTTAIRALEWNPQPRLGLGDPPARLPVFAIGYTGWKNSETLRRHCSAATLDGVLIIDSGLFVADELEAHGPLGLWGLIACLHAVTTRAIAANVNIIRYASDD